MEQRKCCEYCKKPLISFGGSYLHPEAPCSGITDSIYIEAVIQDGELQKKWIEIYGTPKLSDYERVTLLEEENSKLKNELGQQGMLVEMQLTILNNPLVRATADFVNWVKRRFL